MSTQHFSIKHIPSLDSAPLNVVGKIMSERCLKGTIESVNWQQHFPYCPQSGFYLAYSDKYIYIHFNIKEKDVRAINNKDLSPVADDSCVEFFFKIPGSSEYWNFEFNCIGALNASHRETRPNAVRLTPGQLASVKRYASLGTTPFEIREGLTEWSLTAAIPLDLIGLNPNNPTTEFPAYIMGNVYKCSGKSNSRHYVSWAPIISDKPNFHLPEFFVQIGLD